MKKTIYELLDNRDLSKLDNKDEINEIITSIFTDPNIDDYLKIISIYVKAKNDKNISTEYISRTTSLPRKTIERFENLQNIPKTTNLIQILRSIGLKLTVIPIENE